MNGARDVVVEGSYIRAAPVADTDFVSGMAGENTVYLPVHNPGAR